MKVKRILLLILIVALSFATFATIVMIIFNDLYNNPIDNISITYIREESGLQDEYGEIISIGRCISHKRNEDELAIKAPYTVTTETQRFIVYVTLNKNGEELEPISTEVIEVIPNGD